MNRSDIDYIVDKLNSYKPDNIYDGFNSVREKQDQRVSEVLDSIITEVERDYENGNTPIPEQLTWSGHFDEEMAKKIKKAMRHFILEPAEENQWIKCSDRMPEEDKKVLFVRKTWGKNKEIHIGDFDSKMKWWQAGSGVIKNEYVTHWMLLPEPPEEEEK